MKLTLEISTADGYPIETIVRHLENTVAEIKRGVTMAMGSGSGGSCCWEISNNDLKCHTQNKNKEIQLMQL